jgi:hypothetical protein
MPLRLDEGRQHEQDDDEGPEEHRQPGSLSQNRRSALQALVIVDAFA